MLHCARMYDARGMEFTPPLALCLGVCGWYPFPVNFRIFSDRYLLKTPKSGLILEWNHNDKNCVIKKTLAVARFHEKRSFKDNDIKSDDTSVFITEFTESLLFLTTSYFREQLLLLTYFYHTILDV